MKTVLTIAGSDCSGGAGIQADIKMVSSAPMIRAIARKLRQYGARHVVLDPVMVSTSGSKLLEDTAIEALTGELFPCADLITPNIPEAQVLSGRKIVHAQDMERAAQDLSARYHVAVCMEDAVRHAKQFLLGALSTGLNLGKGSGPLNHCFAIGKPQW